MNIIKKNYLTVICVLIISILSTFVSVFLFSVLGKDFSYLFFIILPGMTVLPYLYLLFERPIWFDSHLGMLLTATHFIYYFALFLIIKKISKNK